MFCLKTMIFNNAQHCSNPETILLVVDNAKSPSKPVSFQNKRTYLSRDVPEHPPPPPPQTSDSSNQSWTSASAPVALPPLVRVSASPRIGSSRKSSPRIRSNRKSSQPRQRTSRVSTSPRTTARKNKKSPSFRRTGSHDCIISEAIASTMQHALKVPPPPPPAEERWQSTPTFRSPNSNKKTFRRSGSHDGISEAMKNPPRRTARRRFSASNDRWSASPFESPPPLVQTNQSPHTNIFFRKSINDNAEKTLSNDRKVGGLLVSPLANSSPSKPIRRSSRKFQCLQEQPDDTTVDGQATGHHSPRQPVRQRSRPKIHEEVAGSETNQKPVPFLAAGPYSKSPLRVEEEKGDLAHSSLSYTILTTALRQDFFLNLQSSTTKSVSNEENRTL